MFWIDTEVKMKTFSDRRAPGSSGGLFTNNHPPSDRASDKQATDKAVLEPKRMGRDFKIPIIGISSFNAHPQLSPQKTKFFTNQLFPFQN